MTLEQCKDSAALDLTIAGINYYESDALQCYLLPKSEALVEKTVIQLALEVIAYHKVDSCPSYSEQSYFFPKYQQTYNINYETCTGAPVPAVAVTSGYSYQIIDNETTWDAQ